MPFWKMLIIPPTYVEYFLRQYILREKDFEKLKKYIEQYDKKFEWTIFKDFIAPITYENFITHMSAHYINSANFPCLIRICHLNYPIKKSIPTALLKFKTPYFKIRKRDRMIFFEPNMKKIEEQYLKIKAIKKII